MLDKNTKLISSVALSVFAFSVFYYLVIFLPSKSKTESEYKQTQNLAQEQARCHDSANTFTKELEKKSVSGFSYFVNRYKYDPDRNSCFAEWSLISGAGTTSHIEDVYTREKISSIVLDKKLKVMYGFDNKGNYFNTAEEYQLIQKDVFGY